MSIARWLSIALGLAGCGDDGTPMPDGSVDAASPDGMRDDARPDAPSGDADREDAALDASIDAPPVACIVEPDDCDDRVDSDCDGHIDEGCAGRAALPRNVILFVADGMGFEAIEAARIFANGGRTPLSFETWPSRGAARTSSASALVTDSAAASTAMATGRKVANDVLGLAIPGDGSSLTTALEIQAGRGKRTGLVTITTAITDATPAGFASHRPTRGDSVGIAQDYLTVARPDVLFGKPGGVAAMAATTAGYSVATDAASLAAIDLDSVARVAGLFPDGASPPLRELALAALDVVDDDPEGYFLVIEHEDTDEGAHRNDLSRVVTALLEWRDAIDAVVDRVRGRDDTLLIACADHETGGLSVVDPDPQAGVLPPHVFTGFDHTALLAPLFAFGAGSSSLRGIHDDTELFPVLAGSHLAVFAQGREGYAGTFDAQLSEETPGTDGSSMLQLKVDTDTMATGHVLQVVVRFDDVLAGIPAGANVLRATLLLSIQDGGTPIRVHRMRVPFVASDYPGGSIPLDDVHASSTAELTTPPIATGMVSIDVTALVRDWQSGAAMPHGLVLAPTDSDGVVISSAETTTPPRLWVMYE